MEPEDQKAFDNHPVVAAQLISNIPRLEGVAWIIAHQRPSMSMDRDKPESVLESAEILRVALAFDDFKVKGLSDAAAIEKLQRDNHLNQRAVRALTTLPKDAVTMEVRAVRIWELATGMILQEEIRTCCWLRGARRLLIR